MKNFYITGILLFCFLKGFSQQMVQNINAAPDISGNAILNGFQYNNVVYFVGDDLANGDELWRTDGTPAGTYMLRDINPGKNGSGPSGFTVFNGEIYFAADDGFRGRELWKTDGTSSGTVLVSDIKPGRTGTDPKDFIVYNNSLYFTALVGASLLGSVEGFDRRLHLTNGTEAGTTEAFNLYNSHDDRIQNLKVFQDSILFFSGSDGTNTGLWKLSLNGFQQFLLSGTIGLLTISNNQLFFRQGGSSSPNLLYKWNGMLTLVKTFDAASSFSLSHLTDVNGTLFISANEDPAINNLELWKSDGTLVGTEMVLDIRPGTQSSQPRNFINYDNLLLFSANDGTHSEELWRSDGTPAGTYMVKDLSTGSSFGAGSQLTYVPSSIPANGNVFFSSSSGELIKSNGTDAGTFQVYDFNPGFSTSSASGLVALNGKLILSAVDPALGKELFITDGTVAGTSLLKNIVADESSSFTEDPTTDIEKPWYAHSNGSLYFVAFENLYGQEVWKTENTSASLLADIRAGNNWSLPEHLINTSGKIHFGVNNGIIGDELWSTDGTFAGTEVTKDIRTGNASSSLSNTVSLQGITYFTANDGVNGFELWRSDGTDAGTYMLKDINPGSGNGSVMHLTIFNNMVYFLANDLVSGLELWRTDGTPAGTVMVHDLRPGANGAFNSLSTENELKAYGSQLFFKAQATSSSMDLWKTDGTNFTRLTNHDAEPKYITAVNGKIFFNGRGPGATIQEELYVVDTAGISANRLTNCCSHSETARPSHMVEFNGLLFFNTYTETSGWELGVSDGVTVSIIDLLPGRESSNPHNLTVMFNRIFFAASSREGGVELWETDGTLGGSQQVSDIWPGANGSNPQQLIVANRNLYFIAHNGINNYELFQYNPYSQYSLPNGNSEDSAIIQWNNQIMTSNAEVIATLLQTGAQPLNDMVKAKVSFDPTVQEYNGQPYVQRHYDIEPSFNADNATATVILYFTQQEFNQYNAANSGFADLPTTAGDAQGKSALRVIQYHGVGTAPGNYPGNTVQIDPDDTNIRWNTAGYWEVEFDVTGFSGFYVTTIAASALPVSILSFTGEKAGEKVKLTWKVDEEVNIDRYIIEKYSEQGYIKIGEVDAINLPAATYEYWDEKPFEGMNYYRLKIMELDGSFRYSKVISIKTGKKLSGKVYPVPSSNEVIIENNDRELHGSIVAIIDNNGKTIFNFILDGDRNRIDVSKYPSGNYFIRFNNGSTLRFIKQ